MSVRGMIFKNVEIEEKHYTQKCIYPSSKHEDNKATTEDMRSPITNIIRPHHLHLGRLVAAGGMTLEACMICP